MTILSLRGHAQPGAPTSLSADRRRGRRLPQVRPVKVFDPLAGRYYPGQTRDMSATGLRLELPLSAPLQPGRLLRVYVAGVDRGQLLASHSHMTEARVVWLDRAGAGRSGTLSAGIELLATTAAHMDAA